MHSLVTSAGDSPCPPTVAGNHYQFILECYRPADRLGAPYLVCDYVETTPPLRHLSGAGSPNFNALGGMYCLFRPRPRQPKGAPSADALWPRAPPTPPPEPANGTTGDDDRTKPASQLPTQDLCLDSDELFGQLVCSASLVRAGPKRGIFLAHEAIAQGIVRVWRYWLAQRAEYQRHVGHPPCADSRCQPAGLPDDGGILWTDARRRDVGIRFGVREKPGQDTAPGEAVQGPRVGRGDSGMDGTEELEVEYELELREVLVRAAVLLRTKERVGGREGSNGDRGGNGRTALFASPGRWL